MKLAAKRDSRIDPHHLTQFFVSTCFAMLWFLKQSAPPDLLVLLFSICLSFPALPTSHLQLIQCNLLHYKLKSFTSHHNVCELSSLFRTTCLPS